MELDYKAIGTRIAQRRKQLGLKQSEVEEAADIGFKYLSNIERGISIPSTEVIMRWIRRRMSFWSAQRGRGRKVGRTLPSYCGR